MKLAICGPSYTSQSRNAEDEQCLNRYPEVIESGEGPGRIVLYPTPGLKTFITLSDTPVRGQARAQQRSFAVGGSIFCEIFSDGTKQDYTPIANDGVSVSMAVGQNQILIASAGSCYVFDLTANTLTPIPSMTLTNISFVGYCDGFFLALVKNSNKIFASTVLDATSWPADSVSEINVFPDNLLSMLIDHDEVWLFGITKTAVYQDLGTSPFPLGIIPGGFIEQGIGAANSPVRLDNSIFWLGGDERGNMVAWRANGYTPARVSNHAVELAWQGYSVNSDAIGYSYQDQGHSFWVIYFPTANKTWVYDVATNMWHERGYWNSINGIYTAHRSQNHVFSFNKHLVGDWQTGKIYEMSIDFYDDDGNPLRWLRRAPQISQEQLWEFHAQLQVYMETGVGPIPPLFSPLVPPSSYILQATDGGLWQLSLSDSGILQTDKILTGTPDSLFLNDITTPTTTWQLGVTNGGLITTTAVAYDSTQPSAIYIASNATGIPFNIKVTTGLYQTSPGNDPAGDPSGRDPIINLRWSDDGGHTWSNEYPAGIGKAGQYKKRVIWRRLGRTRGRIYEINGADPVPYRIVDAYLN